MAAIAVLTVLSLGLFVAMIALSLWLADRLERRVRIDMTPLERTIHEQLTKGQPK